MKYALLADISGNYVALEKCLEYIEKFEEKHWDLATEKLGIF